MKVIIGLTGASGSLYGYTLIRTLHQKGIDLSIVMTGMGRKVLEYECGIDPEELRQYGSVYQNDDLFAPIASGSCLADAMVVAPCSMNTLGGIANGMGDNLLIRSAAVTLKENRRLILLVRETPYSIVALENMLRLARAGGTIMPASPGFYNRPGCIGELIAGIVYRILDQLGVDAQEAVRWR